MLILYPVTLRNLFASSNSFFMESVDFLCVYNYIIHTDRFISSFPILMPFIYFSLLIVFVNTSNFIWIKVLKVDILVFFQILGKMLSDFSHSLWSWLRVYHSSLQNCDYFASNFGWVITNVFFCVEIIMCFWFFLLTWL